MEKFERREIVQPSEAKVFKPATTEEFRKGNEAGIWRTSEGAIEIKSMSDVHLDKAIDFTERRIQYFTNRIKTIVGKRDELLLEKEARKNPKRVQYTTKAVKVVSDFKESV